MVPFHAKAELKPTAPAKINVRNIDMLAGPPNRQIGLLLNSSFLYESKRPPFG